MALPGITPEEYLKFERDFLNGKHEYQDGQLYLMAGESVSHGRIKSNLVREIGQQLKGRNCDLFTADMKVGVALGGPYYYPDVVIVCGHLVFRDQEQDVLLNPHTIIEVLSPLTEAFDRGGKFESYQKNEALTTYVLIAQDRPQVTVLVRQPNQHWDLSLVTELKARVILEKLSCRVPMAEIYARVVFPPDEIEAPKTAVTRKRGKKSRKKS